MSKQYVIRWKSTVNGRAGKGTKLFEREEAERLVEELNQEYPQIIHEASEADGPTAAHDSGELEPAEAPAVAAPTEPQSEPQPTQASTHEGYVLSLK